MTQVDFRAWETVFDKQVIATLKTDEKIQHEACDVLFANIVKRTPVGNPNLWNPPYWPRGYVPGTLKDSWVIEIKGNQVDIYNTQPYAERVETGWSKQAPAGMMRISLLEWSKILEKVAGKYRK